jgi:ABC-type Fe3+-siderophore transport system permease subunit
MMIVVASIGVALVAFILYALERRSKKEPIIWEDALKISVFGGLVTTGVVFATTSEPVSELVSAAVSEAQAVQDMFVGTPSF